MFAPVNVNTFLKRYGDHIGPASCEVFLRRAMRKTHDGIIFGGAIEDIFGGAQVWGTMFKRWLERPEQRWIGMEALLTHS